MAIPFQSESNTECRIPILTVTFSFLCSRCEFWRFDPLRKKTRRKAGLGRLSAALSAVLADAPTANASFALRGVAGAPGDGRFLGVPRWGSGVAAARLRAAAGGTAGCAAARWAAAAELPGGSGRGVYGAGAMAIAGGCCAGGARARGTRGSCGGICQRSTASTCCMHPSTSGVRAGEGGEGGGAAWQCRRGADVRDEV